MRTEFKTENVCKRDKEVLWERVSETKREKRKKDKQKKGRGRKRAGL